MANHCEYSVRIIGTAENIQKLYNRLKEQKNFLNYENYNKIFDNPESDDYDWGSKWQHFDDLNYIEGDDSLSMYGSSAWAPAEGLWEKISIDFDFKIELEYSEPGCDLAGFLTWESGVLTRNDEMTWWEYIYQYDNQYFWETMIDYIEVYELDEISKKLEKVLSDEDRTKIEEMFKV
jgi:hypothetical protein